MSAVDQLPGVVYVPVTCLTCFCSALVACTAVLYVHTRTCLRGDSSNASCGGAALQAWFLLLLTVLLRLITVLPRQTDVVSNTTRLLEGSFVATSWPGRMPHLFWAQALASLARAVFLTVAARSTGSGRRSTAWAWMSRLCGRVCFPLDTTKSLPPSLRRFLLGQSFCCYSRTMWWASQRAHQKEVHRHVPGQQNRPPENSDRGKESTPSRFAAEWWPMIQAFALRFCLLSAVGDEQRSGGTYLAAISGVQTIS